MVHRVTKKLLKLKNRVIHFPSHADLENTGNGFAQLAGSPAFSRVVGSIDGCQSLEVKPTFAPEVIACCTILHNICVSNGDIMEPAEEVFRPDDNADEPHLHQDQQHGEQIREHMAAAVSAPDGLVAALEVHDYL
ncbi:hypothetical protein AAFF_G00210500 [Aldrovandia affinis]|uniref:DDE Tnp4 domain-containing protein n=1 Tax=Aldrovandia affinis TaxID=143900 RepID=A0AAD7WVQ1_9TELE|nr:hypothetical protein AAFF_G00210500 [Aldrovandia affinis]